MARKMDNPELVNELIDNLWNEDYPQDEFEKKYASLSSGDMAEVSAAIGRMEKQLDRKLEFESLW